MLDEYADATEPVQIIQLEGTTGAAPAIDRAEGFADVIAENPNLEVVASQTGDFTKPAASRSPRRCSSRTPTST